MARTVDQIKALIYAQVALKIDLVKAFENPSQAKYWGEHIHTAAVNIAVHEQMMDHHKEQVDAQNSATVFNSDWLKARVLEFQYDAVTPQELTLNDDLVPVYDPVDTTKQIISHVVLYRDTSRLIHVRVAKSSPPVKLAAGELTALQSYLTDGGTTAALAKGVGFTGTALIGESTDPDYIWLESEIKYSGIYVSTIQAAVFTAIKNYYYTLEKDGYLRTTTLIAAIKAVPGVNDVLIKNLAIRANGTAFGSKTYLVNTFATVLSEKEAAAGYGYEEVTAAQDLITKTTFTVG